MFESSWRPLDSLDVSFQLSIFQKCSETAKAGVLRLQRQNHREGGKTFCLFLLVFTQSSMHFPEMVLASLNLQVDVWALGLVPRGLPDSLCEWTKGLANAG